MAGRDNQFPCAVDQWNGDYIILVFLAMPACGSMDGTVSVSTTFIQIKIPQQLLDGLPWNFAQDMHGLNHSNNFVHILQNILTST